MKFLFILFTAVLSSAAFAQENAVINDANAKSRTLNASFSAISVSDGIDLYLSQGAEESLAVSYADEKYADRFKTVVEGSTLKIYYDSKGLSWNDSKKKLKAYVSFRTLEKLTASAGADVKLQSAITVGNLDMKFTSGAYFKGMVNAKSLSVDQNSGSDINISGSAEKTTIDVSSGASFNGYDFAVDFCDAKASSGGGVHISVQKELSAKAHSGGDIRYKGTGLIRDINISSGGIVKKAS